MYIAIALSGTSIPKAFAAAQWNTVMTPMFAHRVAIWRNPHVRGTVRQGSNTARAPAFPAVRHACS
jgi:hypothetical protein